VKLGRWLLPCLLAVVGVSAVAVAQSRVTGDEFAGRLDQAIELADLGTREPSPSRMTQLRETLGLPVDVDLGAWRLVLPNDPFLASLVGDGAADFEQAASHILGMRRALEDALARQVPADERIGDALAAAYSGIVQPRPNPVDVVLRAVGDFAAALVYRLMSIAGNGGILVWVTLAVVILAAIILLRRGRLVPEWINPGTGGRRVSAYRVDWAARADEALRAGDLREAVRALYLALLSSLATGGLVADAPALTAGEARTAVRRASPAIYPTIARATDSYERVVYGGATPDQGDLDALREADSRARRG
jgi:hypothetical protein